MGIKDQEIFPDPNEDYQTFNELGWIVASTLKRMKATSGVSIANAAQLANLKVRPHEASVVKTVYDSFAVDPHKRLTTPKTN